MYLQKAFHTHRKLGEPSLCMSALLQSPLHPFANALDACRDMSLTLSEYHSWLGVLV